MLRLLFTVTIFLNSALLFVVEPMIGKYLLPKFGGSPLVWNVAMVFFQAALLLGYLYAHVGTKRVPIAILIPLHLALLAGGVYLGWNVLAAHQEFSGPPAAKVLLTLGATVGLVFFGLAAGSSLIQRLFSHTSDKHSHDPYFLYAASNVGSLLALLAYPVILEPGFTLTEQAKMFSYGVGILLVLLAVCAALSVKYRGDAVAESAVADTSIITNRARLKWIALTAAPSALLLGVTVYLTTDISPIPLLWVVPLSLYLLTFAIAFARHMLPVMFVRVAVPIFLFPALVAYGFDVNSPTLILVPLHLLAFFFLVLACHQQVALSRPSAKHLTEYFLWVSVGGVIGGLFSAIIAPVVFTGLYEYPIAIVACCAFYAIVTDRRGLTVWMVVIPLLTLTGVAFFRAHNLDGPYRGIWMYVAFAGILLSSLRAKQLALATLAVLAGVFISAPYLQDKVIYATRSFYGSRKVTENAAYHLLINGTTLHGVEEMGANKDTPLSYYNDKSGIGKVITEFGGSKRMDRFAVVGLGSGSLALVMGGKGQEIDYYELDPTVLRIAQDPKLFTYLTDCKANLNVIMGDARLSLEKMPSQRYGLLALDAFTSDAIPVHLLTSEAVDDYLRVLKPDGILAVHVSNNYLDLDPVVAAAAAQHNLVAYTGTYWSTDDDELRGIDTSEWIVLAHSKKDLQPVCDDDSFWEQITPTPGFRPWTDEYSNLLTVMKVFSRGAKS